jgi:hypothetical protein
VKNAVKLKWMSHKKSQPKRLASLFFWLAFQDNFRTFLLGNPPQVNLALQGCLAGF